MSGAQIAAEVANALREVAGDVGNGEFVVTLVKGMANPQKPWDTGYYGEPDETDIPALVQDYPLSMINGTLIQQGDRRVMVASTGPRPETGDRLRIQDVIYRIMMVRDKGPSGVPLFYEIQARA